MTDIDKAVEAHRDEDWENRDNMVPGELKGPLYTKGQFTHLDAAELMIPEDDEELERLRKALYRAVDWTESSNLTTLDGQLWQAGITQKRLADIGRFIIVNMVDGKGVRAEEFGL